MSYPSLGVAQSFPTQSADKSKVMYQVNPAYGNSSDPIVPLWSAAPSDFNPGFVGPGRVSMQVGSAPGSQRSDSIVNFRQTGDSMGMPRGGNLIDSIEWPTTSVENTIGFLTNDTVNYNEHVNKAFLPYNRQLSRNQFVFRCQQDSSSAAGIVRNGVQFSAGYYDGFDIILNLQAVNFSLAVNALVGEEDPEATEVFELWKPNGVIVEDVGLEFAEQPQTAKIVTRQRGPIECFNMWGNDILSGIPLWFIYKMVEVPAQYALDPAGQSVDMRENNGQLLKPKAMQIIPWASTTQCAPSDDEVCYYDNEGAYCEGYAVTVGVMMDRKRSSLDQYFSMMTYSTPAMINTSQPRILVDLPSIQ